MPIITISRGCYHSAKEVAEKVAGRLGWECVSRDRLIDESDQFHDPAIKMVRDILDAAMIIDRFPYGKERYTEVIRSALLDLFLQDNIVYHGLAGHHFLGDVPHHFKVRVSADMEFRVAEEVRRECISEGEALAMLEKDDGERNKWSLYLHGVDTCNPDNYDLIVNIGAISVDDAAEIIENTVRLPRFQPTEESLTRVRDMALEAKVKAELFQYPNAVVTARGGRVTVELKAPQEQEESILSAIEELIEGSRDLADIEVRITPYF